MNGSGRRKCQSWIGHFINYTVGIEAAEIFRKWAAIGTISAVLEQKVWAVNSKGVLYPNMYLFRVGHPGIGKTLTIKTAAGFYRELPDYHLSPTSMSMASLVDALVDSKRTFIRLPEGPLEYNSMWIVADELSAFMHKHEDEIIGGLTTFYDVTVPYSQKRRHSLASKDGRIDIKRPQLSILSGTTPSNLIRFMPEDAWDQGFTSRIMMIFSDERIISDDFFANSVADMPRDMLHDLALINSLSGPFEATEDFRNAINNWRKLGQEPIPDHPKLTHYNTRRLAHLLKLSMIAAVDQGNALLLTKAAFNTAMGWLLEAEVFMPDIFKAGMVSADSKAMDEIYHYIIGSDLKRTGVRDGKVVNRAKEILPLQSIDSAMKTMERSGMIRCVGIDTITGQKLWSAVIKAQD